ncbi:MAG TPA: DJ-1/PfpI family protein [Rhizomicrobium sp.]|jgi:transcriptional regulator GlxA family with amidase domain
MDRTLTVAILMFGEVEVLDFAGPFEVFSVAARVARRDGDYGFVPFAPTLVSKSGGMVRARHGLDIAANASFTEVPAPDVLIVPGGVVDKLLGDDDTRDWIVRAHQTTLITASVCTGALVLAKAGLLDGLAATTHWEDLDALKVMAPKTDVRSGRSFVDQGHIVTSGGISAGIDMSLYLVGRLTTPDLARRTARQMEYRWEAYDQG